MKNFMDICLISHFPISHILCFPVLKKIMDGFSKGVIDLSILDFQSVYPEVCRYHVPKRFDLFKAVLTVEPIELVFL